jgi:dTMP kinase
MIPGKFIALEGIDGSGLTTQAAMLRDWFREQGLKCLATKEPTDGPIGVTIKLYLNKRLNGPADDEFEHMLALLFAADRLDHVANVIRPGLAQGAHVVSDRYLTSSLAYQGAYLGLEAVRAMNQRCPPPDLTVFLDVPIGVCRRRLWGERWHPDLFPDLYDHSDKLEPVREEFLEVLRELKASGQQVAVVNGDQPPHGVHAEVRSVVQTFLGVGRPRRTRGRAPRSIALAGSI